VHSRRRMGNRTSPCAGRLRRWADSDRRPEQARRGTSATSWHPRLAGCWPELVVFSARLWRLRSGGALEDDPVLVQFVLDLAHADVEHLRRLGRPPATALEGRHDRVALDL